MRRYLVIWFRASASLLLGIALTNAVVDPYGVFRLVDAPGFNSVKPAAAQQGAMGKAYQLQRMLPHTLVLGNSRAELGLDPTLPVWSAPPVYNAAFPGVGTETSLDFLQLALAAAKDQAALQPRMVVWGLDVMDFLVDPAPPPQGVQTTGPQAAVAASAAWSGAWSGQGRVHDMLASTLTLAALQHTVQTLASQQDPYAVDLTPQGFNPMRDYLKISAEEGYWNLFRQKDQANMASYLRRPMGIFDASAVSSPAWDDLRAVLRLCRQHGIALLVFSYPYHAHLLETIRLTGHWDAFENWKRTLVRILDQEAREARKAQGGEPSAFVFWDFSSFNAWTTEPIPAASDRKTAMRWYWEAGHFKSALGGLMLQRMLGHGTPPPDFGVLLTPQNTEARIAQVRAQENAYRLSHPQDLQDLQVLLQHSRKR